VVSFINGPLYSGLFSVAFVPLWLVLSRCQGVRRLRYSSGVDNLAGSTGSDGPIYSRVVLPLLVKLIEQFPKMRVVTQGGAVGITDQLAVVSVKWTVINQVDGKVRFAH